MGYIVPTPPQVPKPKTPPGGQSPSEKKETTPTNCKNCSAPMSADKCKYCGAVY